MAVVTKDIEKKGGEIQKAKRGGNGRTIIPDVDILEKGDHYILFVDMPAASEDSIDITLEKDTLTIRSSISVEVPSEFRRIHAESGAGTYQRAFRINDDIDRNNIKATYKDGVLALTIPKSENVKTRKIDILTE
ncbi:MAG TPA: Hsp20/alpha crystallin family protein [Nitrospirae bacterium]|nr:Hsp20/alpha crystallin family protein [Nitrospirota bacterium]